MLTKTIAHQKGENCMRTCAW